MKLRACLVCLLLIAIMLPSEGQAFDKQRKGFVLGLGLGYGSAKLKYGDDSESYGGLATTFKIGAGLSEQVLLYYSNRVVFFSPDNVDATFYQGASAVAVSYFLNPAAPSFYFTGELGLGVLDSTESGIDSETGFGWSLGVGFEFSRSWTVEANYLGNSYDDPGSGSNITFAICWLPY
jgi:opacity protein-like surface antigen